MQRERERAKKKENNKARIAANQCGEPSNRHGAAANAKRGSLITF